MRKTNINKRLDLAAALNATAAESVKAQPKYSEFRRVVKVFFGRKLAAIGFVFIVLIVATAIFAPWLAPTILTRWTFPIN